MGDVIEFPRPKGKARPPGQKPGEGDTLCRRGFHKWTIDQKKQFDVKLGKLVTVRRCARCGVRKTTLD